ncbi:hypothetical protein [Nonomuraea zeae]|uniref:Uncharacterized protein n=1 Tax=Nonomuraea zeae TaxID=1642303 RepID=A0A5S4FYJ5_9ACTN|nr:hypothetical protein [Nonomuraea zeae]TMR25875.1 hypothetical protein ETD85_44450 [Nonomuraea zeae]
MRRSGTRIEDYDEIAGARRAATLATYGHQPGGPARAAEAIITVTEAEQPPLSLPLGEVAYDVAQDRLDSLRTSFDAWRELTLGADHPTTSA